MGLLNDKPVEISVRTEIKHFDHLGLFDYAEALANFIKDCETPMTIGVQGDWGIGKTSLLNMIDRCLSEKRFKKIWFNTWHFSLFDQDKFLGISVIRALLDGVARLCKVDGNTKFQKAKQILLDVTKQISIHGVPIGKMLATTIAYDQVSDSNDIAFQMYKFKEEFEKLIQEVLADGEEDKSRNKLVFFIDDIDRVRPGKALELLESLKNFLDVEGCVFVLAVDYEVVQMGMAEKLGKDFQKTSGKSFFDKIIQLPFLMPTTNYQLGDYIGHLLSRSGFLGTKDGKPAPLKKELKGFYEDITSVTVGRNPRSIKRVVNYAKLLDLIRAKQSREGVAQTASYEVQRQILYALICMQIAWHELFVYFLKRPTPEAIRDLENWEFLERLPEARKLFNRVPDEEAVKANISSFFDILFDLLDRDRSGQIDKQEFEPVKLMLQLAKLTSIEDIAEPIDKFLVRVAKNDVKNAYSAFIRDVFLKSKWNTDDGVTHRLAGKRFMTILINRKQVGSLVTLMATPLIFRLAADHEYLAASLSGRKWDRLDPAAVFQPLENASLTGFGDTIVNLDKLLDLDARLARSFLDSIFAAVAKRAGDSQPLRVGRDAE